MGFLLLFRKELRDLNGTPPPKDEGGVRGFGGVVRIYCEYLEQYEQDGGEGIPPSPQQHGEIKKAVQEFS